MPQLTAYHFIPLVVTSTRSELMDVPLTQRMYWLRHFRCQSVGKLGRCGSKDGSKPRLDQKDMITCTIRGVFRAPRGSTFTERLRRRKGSALRKLSSRKFMWKMVIKFRVSLTWALCWDEWAGSLSGLLIQRDTKQKTGTFEKPNKNWRNKKKILTEIEPLQLAF